jgi:hypothetical protein
LPGRGCFQAAPFMADVFGGFEAAAPSHHKREMRHTPRSRVIKGALVGSLVPLGMTPRGASSRFYRNEIELLRARDGFEAVFTLPHPSCRCVIQIGRRTERDLSQDDRLRSNPTRDQTSCHPELPALGGTVRGLPDADESHSNQTIIESHLSDPSSAATKSTRGECLKAASCRLVRPELALRKRLL